MAKFVLEETPATKVLEVVIGEKSYNIPLVSALTFKEAASLETAEGTRLFIQKYIPKDILDPLTIGQYNSIVEAWKAESGYNTAGE